MIIELSRYDGKFQPLHIHIELSTAREAAAIVAAGTAVAYDDIYAALERWQEPGVTNELRQDAADKGTNVLLNLAETIAESPQWPTIKTLLPSYL